MLNRVAVVQMIAFPQGFYRSKTLEEMHSLNVTHRYQIETPRLMQGRPSTDAKNAGKCLRRIASLFFENIDETEKALVNLAKKK